MGGYGIPAFKLIAFNFAVVCWFFVLTEGISTDGNLDKIPFENEGYDMPSISRRFISLMLKRSAARRYSEKASLDRSRKVLSRMRREDDEPDRSLQDEIREEYERRLFESLNIIGTIPATRMYVPEYIQDDNRPGSQQKTFNIEINTVVGKVRKVFPHGKQLIVWPYLGWRNFTVDPNTGEVRTTAKLDFELIRLYNMTIRDFRNNYSDPDPLKRPPMPDPEPEDPKRDYVDHYLIVEVVDRNDNVPKFIRDSGAATGGGRFTGDVNTNAHAGTQILYLQPEDDDSGPRGRIRFDIKTEDNTQSRFTIDPKTHYLKTTGIPLRSGEHKVRIKALDYGMPPKTSDFQEFTVRVGKEPPVFLSSSYNLNFSEANVRGSVVGKVEALSRSGMPMKYEILTPNINKTFAINHLGELTLLRELDYDTANDSDKRFEFDVRAKETGFQGRSNVVRVVLRLINADDHLGMFKTPATTLQFEEGSLGQTGDIFKVDVVDCDCRDNCDCGTGEMIYKIGDTNGFFDITSSGQIRNLKNLDYEVKNYFSFPVYVTDPGKNGRTRTSYVEINVLDLDDTPPKFPKTSYDFAIFEDAPKDQVIGVAQAEDPDPATNPNDIDYIIRSATPAEATNYFYVANQGVIKVLENRDKFKIRDTYQLIITARDKGTEGQNPNESDPPAIVTIRVLDVNDHQPRFVGCKEVRIKEHQKIGTVLTTLTATDQDRGRNKLIEYSLAQVQKHNFFRINNKTGEIRTTTVLDREEYDEIFVVAKATDGGAGRSEPLRQIGYCQFIVKIEDVNDHQPIFTVERFDVKVSRQSSKGATLLYVEATDPDLAQNAIIVYTIISQKIGGRNVDYLEVVKTTGQVKVKNSMSLLHVTDVITLVIQANNTTPVIGSVADARSETTVKVALTENQNPPNFGKWIFEGKIDENKISGSTVIRLRIASTVYSLQQIRDRGNLPFYVDASTGDIKTITPLNYEQQKTYLFAVTARKTSGQGLTSLIIKIDVNDVDDVVPIFGSDKYEATVSELAAGNVDVFRVQASDPDPVGGDKIIYTIEKKHDYQYFRVVDMTNFAQIKTAPNLKKGFFDREKRDVYTIIIEAYRQSSSGLKSTALLTINVRDENDSPPKFVKRSFTAKPIPENIPVPYIVPNIVLNATDNDILENGQVYYFITSGNDGRFSMETIEGQDGKNTGRLIVTRPLDAKKSPEFEKNPVYTLTVTATDRKHTANATIIVKVLDRPDSKPEFLKPYYQKYMPENAGAGLNVVQVEVKPPEDPKAIIRYKLDEIAEPYFVINERTGLIKTAGDLLDWEITPVITFPVYAYEIRSPNITGQTFVRVVVNDVNDAHPLFPDQPIVGYISENLPAGTLVRYINGVDRDNPEVNNGKNVKLKYELRTNTGEDPFDKDGKLFKLDSNGRLTTRVQLDAEEFRRNLSIRVRAWDEGNPRLWGETDVTIVILDKSEFPAWFRKRDYKAMVSETRPPGFVVLQLSTKDRDFSQTNNYAFSMLSGNTPYAFDINQETGEIVVAGVLNFDTTGKKVYTLSIGLKERGDEFLIKNGFVSRPFEDTAKVVIEITAGNDNRPTFKQALYTKTIPENTPVGTKLGLNIEAQDDDTGYSNMSRFVITSGNIGDWFGIVKLRNDSKGVALADVVVQYPLDREYDDTYQMQLVVIDDGGVSDTAWLRITVTDVNDNAPRFLQPFYTVTVTEGACSSSPLATITAVDYDLPNSTVPEEQKKITFDFTSGGNPGNRFRLSDYNKKNSTKLYCTGTIDRKTTQDIKLTIVATDNVPPRPTSTVNVFVHVEDRDKNAASSASLRVIVNAIDGKFPGGPVAKTYFNDRDGDSDIRGMEYTLTGSDEFTVKRDDGWISAKSTVKVGKYQLNIQGVKGSSRPACKVDVTVRSVPMNAIENSAAIQLHEVLRPDKFLDPIRRTATSTTYESITYYDRFVNMLSDLFDVSTDDVFVFSVQASKQVEPPRPDPAIDVHFAIRKESAKDGFLPRWILINILEHNNETLQELGFKLGMIGLDYCAYERLKSGMCRNVIRPVGDEYDVVRSDYGLLPVPNYAVAITSVKVVAEDEYDRYHQDPDPEYDECADNSCLNGGTCHDAVPRGFICECPGAYSGPRCQLTTRTFQGNSYIWLPPKTPHNFGSVSLEFATSAADGLLFYQGPALKDGNNGHRDFLAISLNDGKIRVGLSFGGQKPLVIDMNRGPRLNDNKWHHVQVSHEVKEVTLIIDHCKYADIVEDDERIVEIRENCEIIAKTTQDFQFLNGLGPVQIGGIQNMPLEYPPSKYIVYKYFDGCIRKVMENLEMYDLSYPIKVVNAPRGCTVMAPCPSCLNGGYCIPGFARSVCSCPAGYVGDDCSGNAPRYWYMENSFTEYTLPGEERRKKRATAQEPGDLLDRFSNHIVMQIRVDPGVTDAMFLFAVSEDGLEYSRLGYEEQKLYYEFKLLDALVRLEMDPKAVVADGNWHTVTVSREGNFAVLQVDYKGRVSRNTGGAKKLIRMGSSKIVVGGLPNIAPNTTIVDKVVEASVTDIRYRRRRSAGTILGVTTDGRSVSSIDGDLQGCTGSSSFNGKNLDTDPNVKKERMNVELGCPCRSPKQCFNGGYCVSAPTDFCQCRHGWSGDTCERIVYVAPVLGNRVDGRARWRDGGVLIVVLTVVLCILVLAIALLIIKKQREAPYSVPVGDEGQDSIMPYHDDGAGEEDTFNYDIHHLMKYSYRDGHGTVSKPVNGKELESIELLSQATDGGVMAGGSASIAMSSGKTRESVDLWPFILERVQRADEDMSWWPEDEMRHWSDEGDEGEIADLSEIEDSDDEGEAEQDWEFLRDWGKKFENLNKIFNPEDEDEEEETEA